MRKGFTLIELLIVLAIIGVLMGIGVPMYSTQLTKAKARAVAANLKTIAQTLANEVVLGNEEASGTISDISKFVKGLDPNDYKAYVEVDSAAGTADVYAGYKGSVDTSAIEDDLVGCDATDVADDMNDNTVKIGCAIKNVPVLGF